MTSYFDMARVRAAFALRRLQMSALARRLEISESYLSAQLGGGRALTASVTDALRDALGPDGWAFINGERDDLPAPPRQARATASCPVVDA